MNSIVAVLDRHLGCCPRCMRKAFLAVVTAWALAGAAVALAGGAWPTATLMALALGLTALWLAHVVAFALRATRNKITRGAHRALSRPVLDGELGILSRRRLVADFVGMVLVAAAIAVVPRRAYAASNCGCRVGDICCHPDTHVTWECQDVQGCTMWILTGHKCSSGTKSC